MSVAQHPRDRGRSVALAALVEMAARLKLAATSRSEGGRFAAMAREFQDDFAVISSSRLRALGMIQPGAPSAVVSFGEGDDALQREVKLWHRRGRMAAGSACSFARAARGRRRS